MNVGVRQGLVITGLLAIGSDAAAAEPQPEGPSRAMLGAVGPERGRGLAHGSLGLALVLPQATAALRIGTGHGGSVEMRYKNTAALGHEGQFRLGWGAPVTRSVDIGIAYRTSISSLAQADGGLIGIDFSNLSIGNDWEMGNDVLVTWNRGELAHVTASIGPHWTLGGTRFSDFRDSSFELDPGFRSIATAVQGEWDVDVDLHLVLRLDATILLGTETVPLGFLPAGSMGLAYAI